MRKSKMLLASISIGLILNAIECGEAPAQTWPVRPVTMVVPFAAGSGIDVLGRTLAPALSDILGQQVVVEKIGGAGGMTGAARIARAAPDGYQFVLGNVGTHAHSQSLYAKPLYNPATDFAPVALVADTPQVLIARADLAAGNLQEFIAYTKANQSKLQYGSPGPGSAAHLGCVLLNSAMGVAVTHVPYRGGAQAMQDLIAGRIDYQCPPFALALPQIESQKVKGLAVLTRDRTEIQPSLASAREQGLADFELSTWNAFFLPKGTPPAIVERLHSATMTAMESQSLRKALKQIGAELVPPERRSVAYLQGFVPSEVKKWTAVIRAAGIAAE